MRAFAWPHAVEYPFWCKSVMVNVNVWNYRGSQDAWGHASMLVWPYTYISWWPETPGQVPSKWIANIYDSNPIRDRTYEDDCRDEGSPGPPLPPDWRVPIDGLNEEAIKDWWQSFGLSRDGQPLAGPLQAWSTLKMNCSTVVATALKIGGGDRYAPWLTTWNLVWTPSKVLEFARAIEQGLAEAK